MGMLTLHEAARPAVTLAAAVSIFAALPCAGGEIAPPGPEAIVARFVEAFNAHDVDAMIALAHDDIEWLSVSGAAITIETRGHEALKESMAAYFAACPSCRSALAWTKTGVSRVAVLERATWTAKDGSTRSQASIAVYELEGRKIRRVHYFPAEK